MIKVTPALLPDDQVQKLQAWMNQPEAKLFLEELNCVGAEASANAANKLATTDNLEADQFLIDDCVLTARRMREFVELWSGYSSGKIKFKPITLTPQPIITTWTHET